MWLSTGWLPEILRFKSRSRQDIVSSSQRQNQIHITLLLLCQKMYVQHADCSALAQFFHLIKNCKIYSKIILNINFVSFVTTRILLNYFSVWYSVTINMHIQMQVGLHVQCPLFLSDFNHKWNGSTVSSEYQI